MLFPAVECPAGLHRFLLCWHFARSAGLSTDIRPPARALGDAKSPGDEQLLRKRAPLRIALPRRLDYFAEKLVNGVMAIIFTLEQFQLPRYKLVRSLNVRKSQGLVRDRSLLHKAIENGFCLRICTELRTSPLQLIRPEFISSASP